MLIRCLGALGALRGAREEAPNPQAPGGSRRALRGFQVPFPCVPASAPLRDPQGPRGLPRVSGSLCAVGPREAPRGLKVLGAPRSLESRPRSRGLLAPRESPGGPTIARSAQGALGPPSPRRPWGAPRARIRRPPGGVRGPGGLQGSRRDPKGHREAPLAPIGASGPGHGPPSSAGGPRRLPGAALHGAALGPSAPIFLLYIIPMSSGPQGPQAEVPWDPCCPLGPAPGRPPGAQAFMGAWGPLGPVGLLYTRGGPKVTQVKSKLV